MLPRIALDLRWHNAVRERGKGTFQDNTRKASSHVGDRVSVKAGRPSGTWNVVWVKLPGEVF